MNNIAVLWTRACVLIGFVATLLCCSTTRAQWIEVEQTPSPTVALSEDGATPQAYVSSMQIKSGEWRVKPLYQIQDDEVHVVGLFVFAENGTTRQSNLVAIYFQRPAERCEEWSAKTWESGTAWDAVVALKDYYGIPDAQDSLWEVDQSFGTGIALQAIYDQGFTADDPIGMAVNNLDADSRQVLVDFLKDEGYPVADLPFEKGDVSTMKAWLINAAEFFDRTVGRNLTGNELESAVAAHYRFPGGGLIHPLCDALEICFDVYFCINPPTCQPETIIGELVPDGDACECETQGPWPAACGRFTGDARGKINIRVPYPPPLGTAIEMQVGVGVTIDMCVCVWQRRCMANSKRTVTQVHSDCTRTTREISGPRMPFVVYGFMTAFPADQCQNAPPPVHIPRADEPCGLRTPGY